MTYTTDTAADVRKALGTIYDLTAPNFEDGSGLPDVVVHFGAGYAEQSEHADAAVVASWAEQFYDLEAAERDLSRRNPRRVGMTDGNRKRADVFERCGDLLSASIGRDPR